MDFTYIVAGFISVVVGVFSGMVFLLMKGKSFRVLLFTSTSVAVMLDLSVLIDWSRLPAIPVDLMLYDAFFFLFYALIGCSLGMLPVLVARWLHGRSIVRGVNEN